MEILFWLIGGDWLEFKIVLGVAAVIAVLWFFRGTSWGIGIAAGVAALDGVLRAGHGGAVARGRRACGLHLFSVLTARAWWLGSWQKRSCSP